MCVICIKPAGRRMLKKYELKAMFTHNPHGCGFSCKSMTYKTMSFEDFWQHIKNVPTEEACIIHFRIATHGSVCLDNCHPFTDYGVSFAHNGVLNILPYKGKTDSETAFRRYFLPVIRMFGLYSKELAEAVHRIIGSSKFAFIQDGNLRTFGHFEELDGCYYSNLNHLMTRRWWIAS